MRLEMQNWETLIADRTEKHGTVKTAPAAAEAAENACPLADGIYLFKTSTCPNCKIAMSLLGKAGISVQEIMAYENEDLAVAMGIRQAPTLVVVSGGNAVKYAGVAGVKTYITGI